MLMPTSVWVKEVLVEFIKDLKKHGLSVKVTSQMRLKVKPVINCADDAWGVIVFSDSNRNEWKKSDK